MKLDPAKFHFRALLTSASLSFFVFQSACSSLHLQRKVASASDNKAIPSHSVMINDQSSPQMFVDDPVSVENLPLAKANPATNEVVEHRVKIPVELNAQVEKWIDYFTNKDHERFQSFLDRGELYRDVVESVLEESDLPAELYYLAMIESGYQMHAKSNAKAVGVWQFIAGTGKRYGLRVDHYVDERRDPIRSTEAAAKYLRDLYNVFGSWHLAMAAYNAGEIRILRAIMKARSRNFWELVRLGALPQETANYVPKFLAVVMIGKDPERYGFQIHDSEDPYPNLESFEIPGSISLKVLSEKSGISYSTLKRVNPHLLLSTTPPGRGSYEVWIPSGTSQQFLSARAELLQIAKQHRKIAEATERSSSSVFHIVQRGENLSEIAHQYKVSIGHLMRINGLRSTKIYVGARLRTQAKSFATSHFIRYRVRRGDNLSIIALRFKTSPQVIKTQNKLRRNRIFVGQILKIVKNN